MARRRAPEPSGCWRFDPLSPVPRWTRSLVPPGSAAAWSANYYADGFWNLSAYGKNYGGRARDGTDARLAVLQAYRAVRAQLAAYDAIRALAR